MMKMIKGISILFFLFLALTVSSQNELPTGQIEVIKDFEVRLAEAKKIRIVPEPVVIDTSVRIYEYRLTAPAPKMEYAIPQLKPLALEPEQKPAYYPLFAKAGYGSPNSLLGLFSYDNTQNENLAWGIDLRHLSANNKKIPLQKFSDTQGRLNASYALSPELQLEGYVDGQFENVYFYGAEDIPSNPDALKRSFNRYDVNLNLSNESVENARLQYSALLNYLFDKDDLGSRERSFVLGGEVKTLLGENNHPIGLKLRSDLTLLKDNIEHRLNNILVQPFFQYHTGDFKIYLSGIALLKTEANEILPAFEISYNLFPLVSLYAGWEGEVHKNNFHYLSGFNPYLQTRLDSIVNQISRKIYAGIRGVTGIFNYEANAGYTKFENMAFFLQDSDDEEQFRTVYDNGSYFSIEAAMHFVVLKRVRLSGNAFGRFYSLDNEEKPWHRPSFGIDAQGTYAGIDDSYHISALFHAENGLPYRTVGGTETRLDPLLHLSLHGDYYFTSSLGGFVEVNNILGNKRERWAGYPSFGFNAKAGVMLRL